ncbi:universal stress protein [Salinibaculum rarum]|uniref:universal stress protein n=1 Tax=Salinibaculum rarum TaxID=3058903 RepID=UPI00265F7226|nr:universal stress protein [Salinibaculum sp. KK48]
MYDTILVPTDGSEGTRKTLGHAVEMATRYDASIHALAVVDERQFTQLEGEHRFETETTLEEHCERAVASVAERASTSNIDVTTAIRSGVPSQRIVEYAAETDIDVITMGTHGRSDHERIATVGSVTQRVVENAETPVFVVHIGRNTGWG